jgi:hypothetical protein
MYITTTATAITTPTVNHGDLTNSSNEKLLPKMVRVVAPTTAAPNETLANIVPIMRALI